MVLPTAAPVLAVILEPAAETSTAPLVTAGVLAATTVVAFVAATVLPAVPVVPVATPTLLVIPAVLAATSLLPAEVLALPTPLLLDVTPVRALPLRISRAPSPAGHQDGTILHETPASAAVAPSTINPVRAIQLRPLGRM